MPCGAVSCLTTNFLLPTHTSDHIKVTSEGGGEGKFMQLGHLISILDTDFFVCFRIISLWNVFNFLEIPNY